MIDSFTTGNAGATTRKRASVRLFLAFAGGKALATVLGVLVAVLVGRLLGPHGLGQWTLIVAAGTLLHTAFVNWTHAPTVRFGREEWLTTGTFSRTLQARAPLLVLSIGLATAMLVTQPANWLQRWFSVDASESWMVALVAVGVWLAAEAQATLQASDRFQLQAVVAPLGALLPLVGLGVLFLLNQRTLQSTALTLAILPVCVWGTAWVYGLGRLRHPRGHLREDVERHLWYAWPLAPGFAIGYLSTWCAHLILGRLSSLAEVGLFGLAYQFLTALMSVNSVLPTFLLPWLIRREVDAPGAARSYLASMVPTLYALWMIGTVWLVASLPVAVAMITDRVFERLEPLVLILLVAVPSSVVTSLYTVLFDLQGRLARLVVYMVPATIGNALLCVVLIPRFGSVGAAVATAVSITIGQALYIWDQHRHLDVPARHLWTLWVTGLCLGGSQVFIGEAPVARAAWAIAATTAIALVARASGCVNSEVVHRMFTGRLAPFGAWINRLLIATG